MPSGFSSSRSRRQHSRSYAPDRASAATLATWIPARRIPASPIGHTTKHTTVTYSISEVTVTSGAQSALTLHIDGQLVKITVPTELKAYFDAQFSRPNPTKLQSQKYTTLMNLMKAAYLQGKNDAK